MWANYGPGPTRFACGYSTVPTTILKSFARSSLDRRRSRPVLEWHRRYHPRRPSPLREPPPPPGFRAWLHLRREEINLAAFARNAVDGGWNRPPRVHLRVSVVCAQERVASGMRLANHPLNSPKRPPSTILSAMIPIGFGAPPSKLGIR